LIKKNTADTIRLCRTLTARFSEFNVID